jgi:DNA processing protein
MTETRHHMTMFGLDDREIATLTRALRGRELDAAGAEETIARAAWSGLTEPGDRVAGALVGAIGAPLALTSLSEAWSSRRILASVGDDTALTTEEIEKALARWRPRLGGQATVTAMRQGVRLGARLIVRGDPLWPSGLDDLGDHAPIALWVRGTDEALGGISASISLVGARAATGYGEHVTMEASAGLVDRGFTIVSGAAYGIDGMAHRAALASRGRTVAFLAGGVDRFYPSGHDALLSRMVEEGAVITELPPGAQPSKWRFLQRNRLIAAASQATVVLEAGWRSGSLNTAGHAAALGRALGAVPGPVTSPASAGCHRLIRDFDAVCVTSAQEMAELAPVGPPNADADDGEARGDDIGRERRSDSAGMIRVLDALSRRSARRTDDIAARAGMAIAEVQSELGLLELDGRVEERERGWIRLG